MGLRNRNTLKYEDCFFVTTTCYKWLKLINSASAKTIITDSLTFLCNKYKADILGYVLMPNHIHMIIFFREVNHLSNFMRDFKKYTSVQLRRLFEKEHGNLEHIIYEVRQQKFKIWQDRFDDVCITTKKVLHTKLDYIHNNPLQDHWQLSKTPEGYSYSSAGFYCDGHQGALHVTSYGEYFW